MLQPALKMYRECISSFPFSLSLPDCRAAVSERKQENKLRQTYARIEALVVEHDVDKIVLGLPKMMNNTEGPRVQATREFAENLERRTGLPIIFEDERLTTVEANRILEETGVCVSGRKEHIDKMAAAIILQSYLDREAHKRDE